MEALLQWGESVGVQLPEGLTFEFSEEKGYTAVCNDPNGLVNPRIVIPREAIITNELAEKVFGNRNNTLLKFLVSRLKFEPSKPIFVDGVNITEKFFPYVNILPEVINSSLVWNPAEQALLQGTNLGNSLRDKFKSIFKQWYESITSIEPLKKHMDDLQEDVNLYLQFDNTPMEVIYDKIIIHTTNLTPKHWYSFSAFLWSHLIFTSRAFPEYVINKGKCEPYSVILLPIVDLLNHSYKSKVEWSTDDKNSFIFTSLSESSYQEGDEILNNYGAKGNEELLNGYGFVLENNMCDSVLLKIKLAPEVITSLIHDNTVDIKLPTINDYTTFAFDDNGKQEELKNEDQTKLEHYQDGIVYLLKESEGDDPHDALKLMLQLFTYLAKNDYETFQDIRPKFEAIQHLREAIQQKLNLMGPKVAYDGSATNSYSVGQYRERCAIIYKDSQTRILKDSIKSLKRLEKQMMKHYSAQLLTMARILKHDPGFIENELPKLFQEGQDIEFQSTFDLFVMWIICKIQNSSFGEKHQRISLKYEEYIVKNTGLEQTMTPEAHEFIESYFDELDAETTIQINKAFQYVSDNIFTRISSSEETILVC